ncbi:MAG: homocysteine S-methyltransferase family protein, partial [Spirochaetales bacterium]|nr:homocysteine S-methyltransferase family protein [Spirochaetales bacterium]
MSRKDIRQYLEKNILLFDGAMGTYLTSKDRTYRNAPEAANLEKPELIRDIHMEYLQAGSMAITTNTFGANRQNFPDDCDRIIERGYRLAEEAASKYNAFVFAD